MKNKNLKYLVKNFKLKHLKIIGNNINNNKINWNSISKNEKLSNEFIITFNKNLNFEYLVQYQKLCPLYIEDNINNIIEKKLWEPLIINQKISQKILRTYIIPNIKYWELVIIHQKISSTMICKILRHIKNHFPKKEKKYIQLIFKYQIKKKK